MFEKHHQRAARLARRTLAAFGLLVLASGAAAQDPAPRLEIADYRAYLAEDHPVRQGMRRFAELVHSASSGTLRVDVRSDALPGSPAQQLAALRAGEAGAPALMLLASTGLAPQVPAFSLLDLPFLVRDEREADVLLGGAFGDALLARLAPTGLVGLAWWENGFRQMTSSRGPIRSAGDLRGLRVRVIGEPVFLDTMRALGAEPLALPFSELHAALASKRVEAQDNFSSQILAGRLHEVQTDLSLTRHSYSALVLVANARAWAALPEAQQRLVREAAVQAALAQRAVARRQAQADEAQLATHEMRIHEVAPAERQHMRALTAQVRERQFGLHGELAPLYQAATTSR